MTCAHQEENHMIRCYHYSNKMSLSPCNNFSLLYAYLMLSIAGIRWLPSGREIRRVTKICCWSHSRHHSLYEVSVHRRLWTNIPDIANSIAMFLPMKSTVLLPLTFCVIYLLWWPCQSAETWDNPSRGQELVQSRFGPAEAADHLQRRTGKGWRSSTGGLEQSAQVSTNAYSDRSRGQSRGETPLYSGSRGWFGR